MLSTRNVKVYVPFGNEETSSVEVYECGPGVSRYITLPLICIGVWSTNATAEPSLGAPISPWHSAPGNQIAFENVRVV